jgi:hypothetical protein
MTRVGNKGRQQHPTKSAPSGFQEFSDTTTTQGCQVTKVIMTLEKNTESL